MKGSKAVGCVDVLYCCMGGKLLKAVTEGGVKEDITGGRAWSSGDS